MRSIVGAATPWNNNQSPTCVLALVDRLGAGELSLLLDPGRLATLGPGLGSISCWWDLLRGLSVRSTVAEENSCISGSELVES